MITFYFYLVCFAFSISYSEFPFHLALFSNFSISSFFFMFFLKPLSSIVEKLLCVYVCIYKKHV